MPDLEIRIHQQKYLLDVNWCKYEEDLQTRFDEKQEKYRKFVGDNPNRVIPVIITYNGIVYE